MGGQHLRQGEIVIAILGSANRDPEKFEQPDTLDIMRQPNRHLAFGQGSTLLPGGAPGARRDGDRAQHLAAAAAQHPAGGARQRTRWRLTPMFRSLAWLPVAWS